MHMYLSLSHATCIWHSHVKGSDDLAILHCFHMKRHESESPRACSEADTHINSLSDLNEDILKRLENYADIAVRCSPSKSAYTATTNNFRHTIIDTLNVDYSIF